MTTLQAVNLLRYQYAGSIGVYISRFGQVRVIGTSPSISQRSFLASLNRLYETLLDADSVANIGNAMRRAVPMEQQMDAAWAKIHTEITGK